MWAYFTDYLDHQTSQLPPASLRLTRGGFRGAALCGETLKGVPCFFTAFERLVFPTA